MARRGSAIAGNRAVGTAPSTGGALAPATPASPLAQSLATGMGVNTTGRVNRTGGWGDAYGGLALPRNPQDFTDGAFGPFAPIIPSPVDAPPQGGDFPLARREEYRVGWNLPTGQPGAEGLKLADFGTLRTLADLYSVARACITYLKSEIASLEWDVSPTTEAAKAMRNDKAAMTDFGERRGEAVKFFRRPDPDYFSWQSWMSAVMEEVLVFDALSIVLRPKWGRGLKKGLLWSDLDSLNLISGPTVRPLYDMNGATPRPPAPAYQQYLYGVPRVDMMTMIRQRDLDEGRLRESALGAYTNSQLLYLPMQPRRWTPYGFPPIERALIPVLTGLSKQGYQLDYFKEGTVPSVYISPGGDLSPNQIRELQDALNAVAGDPAWHHKIIVLPSGSHTEPQRPTPLADMFDDIVMTQVCSAFGVQPSQIGITPRATAAAFTSPAAANSAAKQNSNTQDMSTLQPTLLFLTAIMNSLLQDVCGQEDMRFVFAGMQEEEDEETTTNLLVNQVSHALITIDEARDKLGLQPYGITESTEPGFLTPTGFMFLSQPAAPELPPQMGGNDGESGGGNQPPAAPGGKPAPPPQYGPKPNGPANSTQGRPAQPPAKEPGEKSPANAAAEGTNNAKNKPDQGGVNKAAEPDDTAQQPDPDAPDDTFDQAAQLALEAYIAKQVAGIVTSAWGGSITLLEAVGWIIQELGAVYMKVMTAASKSAAAAVEGVAAMATGDLFALAQQRAEQQRPYSMGMVQAAVNDAAMGGTEPPAWIQGRAKLYAETLAGSYNCGYGETVKTSEPDYTLIWRLGETEHCPLCLERDGNEYTFESLPGYPGDGGFGGPICKGGPNCGCHLEYRKGDRVDTMGNPHRGQMEYYAQQKKDIMARRQQMQAEREQFVAGLPNQTGTDGTSAQSRAVSRDQMRQQLADLANQRIRSNGGYPGVSVEPSDIPASLIASLIPQYGPIPATVPLTDIMNAVESMFAGKFTGADVTKTAFSSLVLGVVVDTVSGWERAVASEMEACARHLDKGRAAGSWQARRIDQRDVDTLADLLQTGAVSRADAVKQALDNRRRWVDVGGQIMEPPTATPDPAANELPPYQEFGGPVANATRTNPAGGGGYTLLPHDANGIYHDAYDLTTKAASDPGDPNPVEAEHVYNQMLANYPPKSIQWIKQARWIGPMAVDPERVDTQDEDSWAASHEPDRIKHFIKDIKKGKDIKPGVCVQEPGQDTVKVIDGHHRFLAARESGEPYKAYVGFVNSDSGPWDETHSFQFHQGADPQNKTVEIDLRGSQVMNDADLDRFIQMFGERLAKSAVPGLTKRSGMVSIDLPDGLIEPVPGGPTDHHITLAYLGPDVDDGTLNDVLRVAKSVAANSKPFTVTAGGVDAFPPSDGSDGKVPAYVPVDATDKLKTLREPFAQYHASEHQGFTPHVTLAYLNESEALPEPVPQVTIPVDAVHVHRGDQVYQIPFGYDGTSPITVKSAETPALSTVHKPLGTHGLWHDKDAQLPAYIQNVAHGLIKDGHDESEAIQLAIGAVKRWAAGEGKVTPEVQAAAAGALAEWEKLKAEHSKTKDADPELVKVGPKGYVHGWIRAGAGGVRPGDLGMKYKNGDREFDVDHARSGTTLATGKVKRDGSYTVTHKDGTKLGTFHSLGEVQDAVARHHNEKYSTFDRDTEPELAGYHDAVSGHERTFEERDRSGDEDAYSRGHAQGTADLENNRLDYLPGVKTVDPELTKVGPRGYIHGWIFVGVPGIGDEVNHPSHGKGTITGHDDKHVTVHFANGKDHSFEVHRDASEEGHFTERGKLEHPGAQPEHPADRALRDHDAVKDMSDKELKDAASELLNRTIDGDTTPGLREASEKVGVERERRFQENLKANAPKGVETDVYHIRRGDVVMGPDGEFHRVGLTLNGHDTKTNDTTRVLLYGEHGRIEAHADAKIRADIDPEDLAAREKSRRMSPSQISIGDRVKGFDGKFHTVDSTGISEYDDGTRTHRTYLHNGDELEGPAGQHLEVQTKSPEYAPLFGSEAERMAAWKADTQRPGVGDRASVDDMAVDDARVEVVRAQHVLRSQQEYAKEQANRYGYTAAETRSHVKTATQYEQQHLDDTKERLAAREDERAKRANDQVSAYGVLKRGQPIDPSRPLAVYGDKLHIENQDARTFQHLAEMESLPAHIHATVASDMARHAATSGVFIGSHPVPDQDDLQNFRDQDKKRNKVDTRSWDQVGGVHSWGPHKTAVGYSRGAWTLDTDKRVGNSTARHELGHHFDNAMSRVYSVPASSTKAFRDLWSLAKRTHGARANPYFFDQGEQISPAEFFAEALSRWGAAGTRGDRVAGIQKEFDVSARTASQIFDHMEQVSADARTLEGS